MGSVAVAGLGSGLPSTLIALARGEDPLAATRAAGALAGRRSVPTGAAVHVVLSLWWGAVVAVVVRRAGCRRPVSGAVVGAACGAAIASLDLGLVGRTVPEIATLPRLPQWLDHLAFGALMGVLVRPRSR